MIKGRHNILMKCLTVEELPKVHEFYIDILVLKIYREWTEGIMFDTGKRLGIFIKVERT